MLVGPGMARNSRPARTVIFFYSLSAEREIEASWGLVGRRRFKSKQDNIRSRPSLRAQRSNPEPQKGCIAPISAMDCTGLFSHCIGDRAKAVILPLARSRARDGYRGAVALPA